MIKNDWNVVLNESIEVHVHPIRTQDKFKSSSSVRPDKNYPNLTDAEIELKNDQSIFRLGKKTSVINFILII